MKDFVLSVDSKPESKSVTMLSEKDHLILLHEKIARLHSELHALHRSLDKINGRCAFLISINLLILIGVCTTIVLRFIGV